MTMASGSEMKERLTGAIAQFNDPARRDEYIANYAPDVVLHGYPPELPTGRAGAHAFYSMIWSAFPDCKVAVEDMIAEGDQLAVRYRVSGTHQGEFAGSPPTGNVFDVQGMTIIRFRDGLFAERWTALDMMGLLQQTGAIPAPDA